MAAADVFNRVVSRCPFDPNSGKWTAWIDQEMRKTEDMDTKIIGVQRRIEDEKRRHRGALASLEQEMIELRKYCDHEMKRGTAECEPVCSRCGWSAGDDEYRRS